MMEYTNKYWKMLMPLIKRSLTKRLGKEETAELKKSGYRLPGHAESHR